MNDDVARDRLHRTDPARWRALAQKWRHWATLAGRLAAEFLSCLARLGSVWSGAAATAAVGRLRALHQRLVLFRVACWQADQAISEFAAALDRARALPEGPGCALAATADANAAGRLDHLVLTGATAPPGLDRPACDATPAEVARWWRGLSPAQREWLLADDPAELASLDGVPAADRDAANRLLLDDRRDELARALAGASGKERRHLTAQRDGLDDLVARLDARDGQRAYLLRLDLAGDGRTVIALGDPDHADDVLTHVPGMTSDLASYAGELSRAERVAARAAQLNPAAATTAVLWLDYDATDFLGEASGTRQAVDAAPALRRFQDGLRVTHEGPAARQTVLGHSYGSLVVGEAAAGGPLAADDVVFVGSPGVGVNSADRLRVPAGHVWASTSVSDPIQYAAVSPGSMLGRLAVSAVPGVGPLIAAAPGHHLWFGVNPDSSRFGAHVFPAPVGGGHLGYWNEGRPLDTLAEITLGAAR